MRLCNECGERWGFCTCKPCSEDCGQPAQARCAKCEERCCAEHLYDCVVCAEAFCLDHIVATRVPDSIFQALYHCRRCLGKQQKAA